MVKFPVRHSTARRSSLGHQQPAQPPARHREILRKAVRHNGIARRLPGTRRFRRARVDQPVIHLVADQPRSGRIAPGCDGREFFRRDHRAGGVGRAGHDHALHRRIQLGQHLHGRLKPGFRSARDLHHLTAQCRQDVAVAGIARAGDGDPVTGVEARQERQQEATRGPGGHHHVVGADVQTVAARIGPGDRLPQLRYTQRDGVPQLIGFQRGRRGRAHRFRGADTGLARRQVHQVAVGALALRGGQPHVHHIERRDPGSQRNAVVHSSHARTPPPAGADRTAPAR